MKKIILLVIMLSSLFSTASYAEKRPKVEYSADITVETASDKVSGTVAYAPNKERQDVVIGKQKSTIITRHDKKVGWTLMPEQKMYMEFALDPKKPAPGDTSGYKFKKTKVGPESVNGVDATKYKVDATGPDGEKMDGFIWETADGIKVKTDLHSRNNRMVMELSHLKIGRQDASLFEIPSDYAAMDIKGMLIGAGISAGKDRHRSHVKRHNEHKEGQVIPR